jgi:energy-coupling factor transport system permease protein
VRGTIALAYAPRRGPLGASRPSVAALYLAPLAVAAFAFANPLVLLGAGLAALAVARGSDALAAVAAPLRLGAYLAVTIVLINGLVSQRGETILIRGWELPVVGRLDISAEALAEGGILALRILVALAVFAVWSACVDPDRILRAIRPLARRSALTATMIARLVPLAAADAGRLREAGKLRGPAAAPATRGSIARRLIAGSLERSVDVAATLELRGFAAGTSAHSERRPPAPGEWALLGAATAMAVVLGIALTAGIAGFSAYPTLQLDLDPATLALAASLPLLALVPFALPRELAERAPALGGGRLG